MSTHQILKDEDGTPRFAVIPYPDYVALIEDMEDIALIDEVRKEGGAIFSDDEVGRMIEQGVSSLTILRERASITQAELAMMVGTSSAYISQMENGHRNPGAKLKRKIATALGVSPPDLDDTS